MYPTSPSAADMTAFLRVFSEAAYTGIGINITNIIISEIITDKNFLMNLIIIPIAFQAVNSQLKFLYIQIRGIRK